MSLRERAIARYEQERREGNKKRRGQYAFTLSPARSALERVTEESIAEDLFQFQRAIDWRRGAERILWEVTVDGVYFVIKVVAKQKKRSVVEAEVSVLVDGSAYKVETLRELGWILKSRKKNFPL